MSSYTPELYFLLLPLLATIPYGASFHTDLNSGLVKNLFLKTKKRHYFAAKYLAVFLSGAAAVLIPLLVNLALTAATLPSLMPEIGPRTFPVMTTDMWAGLFYTHPYAYLFAYLLLIALFSGFLPAISLCVSFYVKNRFAVLLSPFILCLFIHSVSQLLGNHSLDPITYLNPGAAYSSVPLILLELIPLAVVTFLLFMVKGCRDDTF
ncbi:MAG: hypothetical protein HFJ80_07965 [Clostridiales bacterium]|nr:hypothetical protein [Clostridiales bacterium]